MMMQMETCIEEFKKMHVDSAGIGENKAYSFTH